MVGDGGMAVMGVVQERGSHKIQKQQDREVQYNAHYIKHKVHEKMMERTPTPSIQS